MKDEKGRPTRRRRLESGNVELINFYGQVMFIWVILLKKANTPIEFTKEQIEEYIKCKDDPVYLQQKLRPDCNPGPWSSTI